MTDLIQNVIRQMVKDEVTVQVGQAMPTVKEEKPERLLTANEACEFLRCSKPTLHRWKSAGIVPHVRIGSNIRYKESDLQKVLTSRSK